MSEFPYSIWSKFNPEQGNNGAQRQETFSSGNSSLDGKVASIAHKIANVAIHSGDNDEDSDKNVRLEVSKGMRDALLLGSVVLLKVLLFCCYRAAQDAGLQVTDL